MLALNLVPVNTVGLVSAGIAMIALSVALLILAEAVQALQVCRGVK